MELKDLYQKTKELIKTLINKEPIDFRLEQAAKSSGKWDCVVSYLVENKNQPEKKMTQVLTSQTLPYERIYKSLKINLNGEFQGLYIHKG